MKTIITLGLSTILSGAVLAQGDTRVAPSAANPPQTQIEQLTSVCIIAESGRFTTHLDKGQMFFLFQAITCDGVTPLTWFVSIDELKKVHDKKYNSKKETKI